MSEQSMQWSLAQIWNGVAMKENRPLKERDYIYASELGMPLVDRYLKMRAVGYTNPPNNRSLRKFLAGNIWEYVVKSVLISAGILRKDEKTINATPYEGMLSVHGRSDYVAGGFIDKDAALEALRLHPLPDTLNTMAVKIIEAFAGATLKEMGLELKSTSTFAFSKVEDGNKPIWSHAYQAYHYQRNSGMDYNIAYICKDDCRMAQFPIIESEIEPLYRADIEAMTYYFNKQEQPPLAPLLLWDDTLCKFSKNLGIEYSPYLTLLYGFETPDDYRKAVAYAESWNRVLDRVVKVNQGEKSPSGKPIAITPKNKEVIGMIEQAGYKIDDLAAQRIALGISDEENEEF